MIAWANVGVLVVSAVLFLVFYVKSVGPAALEVRIGPVAYQRCTRYRMIAAILMTLASANYVLYVFHPLSIGLPLTFPWPWWLSALIALVIALPSGYLWWRGLKDAGSETMTPRKEHVLYGGIYEKIRHPQAVGEMPFFWVLAFLLHSPFLVIFTFVWIPIFILCSLAEERDLIIRYGDAYRAYRERTGFLLPRRQDGGRRGT